MFALAPMLLAAASTVFPLGTPFARGTDAVVAFIGSQPVIVWRQENALRSAAWNGTMVPPEGISTIVTGTTSAPALAAIDDQALAVWIADGHVDAVHIAGDGQPIGKPLTVSPRAASRATVIGSHSSYLVVWSGEGNSISCGVIGRSGGLTRAPIEMTLPATSRVGTLAGASNGTDFLVTWDYQSDEVAGGVFALRVTEEGSLFGDVTLQTSLAGNSPSAAWNGREYLIVWQERGIRGMRVTNDLHEASAPLRLTTLDDSSPRVVWDGSGYVLGVARYELFHHAMFFVARTIRLAADATPAETLGGLTNEAVGSPWFALAASNGRALLLRLPYEITVSEAILGPPLKLPRRRL